MATLTKAGLEKLLTTRLRLKAPRFALRLADGKLIGGVISDSFKGKTNRRRQKMMWDALHRALGDRADRRVGMLLPYTDDEWDEPLEGMPPARAARPRARKAG